MSYFQRMRPYAERASAQTGLPVSVILAQWALETGYGTSVLAREHNNHGGIKFTHFPGSYNADGQHAGYPSVEVFVADYVRVLRLSFYAQVRRVAKAGGSPHEVIDALDASPYAEDPEYGAKLKRILREGNLVDQDQDQGQPMHLPELPHIVFRQPAPGTVQISTPDGSAFDTALLPAILTAAGLLLAHKFLVSRD